MRVNTRYINSTRGTSQRYEEVHKYKVHKLHQEYILKGYIVIHLRMYLWTSEDVPLVEVRYLVFTHMPGTSYYRQLGSLLYVRYIFRALINSLVCWFCTSTLGLIWFQMSIKITSGLGTAGFILFSKISFRNNQTLADVLCVKWVHFKLQNITGQQNTLKNW